MKHKGRSAFALLWATLACCLAVVGAELPGPTLRLHPENGHYFEFRGKTAVLVGSGEHYGAVINQDFDYLRYLDEVKACGLNYVRVFSGAYRENPGAFKIENNTLSPPRGRFIAPWARSDAPGAADGGNKFDLTQWNATYFHRLSGFVRAAGERGIVVELTLFCTFYDEDLWQISPMNAANHINGAGAGKAASCYQKDSDLVPFHKALTRKCAEELARFDNVFFEIINEPYVGGVPNDWQNLIIDELAGLPEHHLIAQNIANEHAAITKPHPAVSIFNFHYAKPQAASDHHGLNRVIGDDETGFKGAEDFPYRREAWAFMLAGGGLFNHLDYSFTAGFEDGTATQKAPGGGGRAIRRQFGVLRGFLDELPLTRCKPLAKVITSGIPAGGGAQVLGSAGEAYGIYLYGGKQAKLTIDLPAGTYRGRWIDPQAGTVTADVPDFSHAGGSLPLASPAYEEDAALSLFSVKRPE